jgi:hypothetical protein
MLRLWQILGALLLAISINTQPADAVTVNTDGHGHATSVTDLIVGGSTYDVDFVLVFDEASAVMAIDFTSAATALTAVDSLDAALNAAGVTGIVFPIFTTGSFAIPTSVSITTFPTVTFFEGLYDGSSWQADTSSQDIVLPGDLVLNVADFTLVGTTPLPAAFPLFATGLGGLVLLGWRRKRKNAAAIAA